MEQPLGSRPEEEIPPPHPPKKDVTLDLIALLNTKGPNDDETKRAFLVWEEFNGLEEIQQDNNVDAYVKLVIKKAELLTEAGFKDEAIKILNDLLIVSQAHYGVELEIITAYIDNLTK